MSTDTPFTAHFDKYVNGLLKKFKVPSLAIAIIHDDHVSSKAYDETPPDGAATTPATLFPGGSTTKSLLAAALTLLVDDGLIQLSDPLRKYLPGFEMNTRAATLDTSIEDALSHRSGLPRHDHAYGIRDDDGNDLYDFGQLLKALPHLELTAEPRAKFQYNNIMYMVATHVVEVVSGKSFESFLQERLFGPLGMDSTYVRLETARKACDQEGRRLAKGLVWDTATQAYADQPWQDSAVLSGAANVISNVLDFAKYLQAMINESPPLSKDGYKELRTARSIQPPENKDGPYAGPCAYTLGWDWTVYHGENIFSHFGGVVAAGALMCYIPSKKWGVAMLTNTERASNHVEDIIWHRLMDNLLSVPLEKQFDREAYWEKKEREEDEEFDTSVQRLFPDAGLNDASTKPESLEAFVGRFEHPGYGGLTLSVANPKSRYPGAKDGPLLLTDLQNRTWPFQIQFQCVNGLHFIAWKLSLEGHPTQIFKGAMKAEFRVDYKGEVEALGLDFETEMKGKKIWFDKTKPENSEK